MTTSFDLIGEDFSVDLRAIRRFLDRANADETTGAIDTEVRLTSSHAAILLIAASFEEFVRETVRAYAAQLLARTSSFSELPASMTAAVWERSLFLLKGSKYGGQSFDRITAIALSKNIAEFCLNEDKSLDISTYLAFNERNLTIKEFNEIMRRVGLGDYAGTVGRNQRFIDHFGTANADKAHAEFVVALNGFYETRNEVAHAIGSLKASGPTNIERFIEFFEVLEAVVTKDLNER